MTEIPTRGTLIVCRADQLIKKVAELKPRAVLSIEHPGAQPGAHGSVPRLTDGTPQMVLTFWDSEEPCAGGPDIEQVEKGLAFVMENITKGDVIIHCNAGVSRSTALALGVLSLLNPRASENELIDRLLEIRPIAAPNILVVGLVDELTGRGGRLLKAVAENEKITAARHKADIGRNGWLQRNPDTYRQMHPEKFPPPPTP